VGGVLAAFFVSGGTISLGSLVGFLTILGIAARNGIMLISHYQHLEEGEGETFGPGLALRGTRERLAPILMTALATGLALVPLVIAGNIPGHEKEALQEVLGDPDARLELRPEFEERLRQTMSYVISGGRLLSMEELTSQLDASDV
jgi:multidrug efflux pump subunit AcrB